MLTNTGVKEIGKDSFYMVKGSEYNAIFMLTIKEMEWKRIPQ
jgi:hypothetical protein